MPAPDNLKLLQQRVYWYYHQDGLLDISLGIVLIGFGLSMLTGNAVYDILAWIIPLALYILVKKTVTFPRIGYVQFQSNRTVRWGMMSISIGVLLLILVLGLVILVRSERLSASWQAVLSAYHMLIVGVLFSIPLILISALTGLRRPLGYIGLTFLVILVGIQLGIQPPIYMIALGVILLLIGSIYLGKFLARYPLHLLEPRNGG